MSIPPIVRAALTGTTSAPNPDRRSNGDGAVLLLPSFLRSILPYLGDSLSLFLSLFHAFDRIPPPPSSSSCSSREATSVSRLQFEPSCSFRWAAGDAWTQPTISYNYVCHCRMRMNTGNAPAQPASPSVHPSERACVVHLSLPKVVREQPVIHHALTALSRTDKMDKRAPLSLPLRDISAAFPSFLGKGKRGGGITVTPPAPSLPPYIHRPIHRLRATPGARQTIDGRTDGRTSGRTNGALRAIAAA